VFRSELQEVRNQGHVCSPQRPKLPTRFPADPSGGSIQGAVGEPSTLTIDREFIGDPKLSSATERLFFALARPAWRARQVGKPNLASADSYRAKADSFGVHSMHARRVGVWPLTVAAMERMQESPIDRPGVGSSIRKFVPTRFQTPSGSYEEEVSGDNEFPEGSMAMCSPVHSAIVAAFCGPRKTIVNGA
jgi:hypothetical protein